MELEKKLDDVLKAQKSEIDNGFNDYNLLTTVLSANDEVRLHSRVIYSLLDKNANHYRKKLFLKLFLETIKEDNFFDDLSKVEVKKEHEYIDLYLTDGEKHIIIENKIYASDQPEQIEKYVEKIKNENNTVFENLMVIYLSIDRKYPTTYSLGNLKVKKDYLYDSGEKVAKFKSVHYENEIIKWLECSIKSINNITNLKISLEQYLDVVKKISNKKYLKITPFEKVFENEDGYDINIIKYFSINKNKYNFKTKFQKHITQLEEAYKNVIDSILNDFLSNFCEELLSSNELLRTGGFVIDVEEPFFYLLYKEVKICIYLKKKKYLDNLDKENLFNIRSIALRPSDNWSYNGAIFDNIDDRNTKFLEFLENKKLEGYKVGKIKGIMLDEEISKDLSFEDIYKISKGENAKVFKIPRQFVRIMSILKKEKN